MGKKLVITGRGGTGKSTFAALAARFVPGPRLLVDADPDQSLAALLGVDLEASDVHTVAQVLYEIQGGKGSRNVQAMPLAEKIEYLLELSCVYESPEFDMLTLGIKWTRGCYCAPNDVLRAVIPRLSDSYATTILDSPAGLEHINRRVFSKVDDVFAVADPSAKALRNTEAVRDLSDSIGFAYKNLYVVANYRFPEGEIGRLTQVEGVTYLGRIPADPAVQQCDWEGRSVLDLPADSPAVAAVQGILEAAGHRPTS